jgi:hypothetical protein
MGDSIQEFAPPAGPPPNLKRLHALEVARLLRPQGWGVLNLATHPHYTYGSDRTHELYPSAWPALEGLFQASRAFFAQPEAEKAKYLTKDGSEEGYASIKGEKEFITLRRNDIDHCPAVLQKTVQDAWEAVFHVLNEGMRGVEIELGLPAGSLTRFAEPCLKMDARARATMLRLFRYENDEAKTVAERKSRASRNPELSVNRTSAY